MNGWPKLEVLLLALGLCCISFASGYVAHDYVEPATYRQVKEALASVYKNLILPRLKEPWERYGYYYQTRQSGEGVQRHDARKAQPGYTLFSTSFEPAAYLVDMQGRVLHTWRLPFSAAWRSPPHIDMPVPDKFVYFRRTHLFPNGDLLAIYETYGQWPYAYGLIKLDKDSRLVWAYADLVHHDLEVAADGRIYTLVHQVRKKPDPELVRLRQDTVIDDAVVILSPDGREIERISLLSAFLASRYAPLLTQRRENETGEEKDILHTNSVQIVTPEIARIFPFAEAGQVLLSHNHRGTISLLDPRTRTIVWALQVSRLYQHSARFLPNGTIAVLKNADNFSGGGRSRVATVDPATGGETWAFAGDKHLTFQTHNRGSIQELPNGNMLITETNAGRLLEVTPGREIVWEYRVGHAVKGRTPAVLPAVRIDPGTLMFLSQRDGAAQKP